MRSHDARDFDDPMVINLHDKHVAERMPIHQARTEAELGSCVVAHATVAGKRRFRFDCLFGRVDQRRIA